MKLRMMNGWRWALVLAGMPLVVTSLQAAESDNTTGQLLPPAPAIAQADLPPNNISTPPDAQLSGGAAEIAKLAQGGVGEPVMLAFVGNVASKFNLGSNQIIYLNDLGVSAEVVNAMIQRDAALEAASQAAAASLAAASNPNYPNADDDSGSFSSTPPPDNSSANPPYDTADYATTEDANYFYNALAPYGSWVNLNGSGLCWQPTVCLANRDWRPYGDRGRWLDSDCGWYWQSDYSWGWAPFHYGRWLNDANRGWVWSPDRVWGPAWVSWRHSRDYCGWAPLPLSARFVPGTGFVHGQHAGANFEFGLQASHYTFVPLGCLSDYSPARYAVPSGQADVLFNQTQVINEVTVKNHYVVHHGIDPREVAAAARTEIRHVEVREMSRDAQRSFQPERLTQSDHGWVIFHPPLPSAAVAHTGSIPAVGNAQQLFAPGRSFTPPKISRNMQPPNAQPPTLPQPQPAATPLPQMNFARFPVSSPVSQPARTESYPPGSLIIIGKKTASNSQSAAPVSHRAYTVYQTSNPQAIQPPSTQPAFNFSASQTTPAPNQSAYVIPARFTAVQRMATSYSPPQNTVAAATHAVPEPAHAQHEREQERPAHESHVESHAAPVEPSASPVAAFHSSVSSLSPASVSGHR